MSDCRYGVSPVNYPDPDPHRCGFEPSSGHVRHAGGQVFLGDLPFSPHLTTDSAQNE